MQFDKSPLSIADQVQLLKDRGLKIEDENRAAHYLSYIMGVYETGSWRLLPNYLTSPPNPL